MTLYKHVISLGWFCSVAEEIEKLGLRSASYPFDWILTDWKTVEEIMKGEFADYLKSDKLIQDAEVSNMYHHSDRKCLVYVHDIDPYENYEKQIEKAQMKYADKIGAKFTLVLGDSELEAQQAKIKNMATGEQTDITLGEGFAQQAADLLLTHTCAPAGL